MHDLDALDPVYVAQVLSKPPFVTVPGVINVRDLGLLPSATYPGKMTKPRYLYRSAEISGVLPEGKKLFKELNITTVFDLRSDTEIRKYNSPLPEIDGVEIVHIPVFKTEDYSPEMMAKRFQLYASGKTEREARVLTGYKLAGVDDETIAKDYSLTRVGREPAREMIMARLSKEPLFQSNNEAALNMFTCRHDTMIAFLKLLQDKYHGVEAYVKKYVGFNDEDIATVRDNILVSSKSCL
ncbi:hypothetical protein NP233_g1538 [Leucocoprinus birnbaumii]|uniref:Tyrosine phosphatase n=1 Tax=Leucocoprinus birnbaumii TaxID=56174 RepID=A0AAD5YZK9_9AGAR|nr:hypothetical protein NP233_g1538 [Leucocoprinus birnbaumii]